MVDEDAVARVREVERDVLVGLFGGRAAVGVPDVDDLAVLHQRPEAFTEAVHRGAHAEAQLLAQVVGARRVAHDAHALGAAAGQQPAAREEVDLPGARAGDPDRQRAGGEGGVLLVVLRVSREVLRTDLERGALRLLALEVGEGDADDVGYRGMGADRHDRSLQQVAAAADGLGRREDVQPAVRCGDLVDLGRVRRGDALTQQPVAVGELHLWGVLTSRHPRRYRG